MGQAVTILFAEDDDTIRDAQAELLSEQGFRVLTAKTGAEALSILSKEHVDVLFTDVVMPEIDGVELANRAKLLRPDLKIILATGYISVAGNATAIGRLLFKPLRAHEIEAEIRTMLGLGARSSA